MTVMLMGTNEKLSQGFGLRVTGQITPSITSKSLDGL